MTGLVLPKRYQVGVDKAAKIKESLSLLAQAGHPLARRLMARLESDPEMERRAVMSSRRLIRP